MKQPLAMRRELKTTNPVHRIAPLSRLTGEGMTKPKPTNSTGLCQGFGLPINIGMPGRIKMGYL
jgi:hypothetical protein